MCNSLLRSLLSLSLAYVIFVSFCLPLGVPQVAASSSVIPQSRRAPGFNSGNRVRVPTATTARAGRREQELRVRFRRNASHAEQRSLAAAIGAQELKPLRGNSRVVRMSLSPTQTIESVAVALQNHYLIESAEPNF